MTTPTRRVNTGLDHASKTGLCSDVVSNQGLTERRGINQSKSNYSLLLQPTIMENSPACEATLHRIGSASKLNPC